MLSKKINKFSFPIAILLAINSCNNHDKSSDSKSAGKMTHATSPVRDNTPIKIVLTQYGGDHSYALILGSDSIKVALEYNAINTYSDSTDKSLDIHKHILSEGAIAYIWKYVQDNCIPSSSMLPSGENYYNIGRATDTPLYKTGCRIESKEQGLKYFAGLIRGIENSSYSNECKYLVADIQAKFIDGKQFPFAPAIQHLIDSMDQRKKRAK